ncbi:nicotinate-nucleotide--dimethylbenzimidazole phosphoribosyltransferase [Streptomyces sp. NBC_00557]|uniref:nicotinate-nucleotide--dimethylbenzimidazole phosphoribosyltransferase n=1 Tax=Streptomyces sp. NBC_00557 TaxID=2975776 RepID=UPI002E80A635|nr:nicotinate-nucleotide--dimethylbenzimidazole phosphoribosyltransferase [Streptomyces sp. NBC_00557]WUC38147.1 nicotinate-nucleotide--dimethylbenzimidazole phosphoribosyltransferase [Streptomyces sp. NBC_00557]
MTDTGQVPGEGQPESAGMVEQPGVAAHGAYTYLSEAPAEDEDLLLPGAQGAWGNEVPPPAPEPVVEAVHQPGPHETAGRDSGSVDLSGVRLPNPAPASVPPSPILSAPQEQPAAAQAPRRPLHLGPPIPDASASPVRSLADRGPAGAPVRQPGPVAAGPEYLDAQPPYETAPQGAAPWGAAHAAQADAQAPAAETVDPAAVAVDTAAQTDPSGAAQAAVTRLATQAAAPVPGTAHLVHGHDGVQPAHGHDGVVHTAPTAAVPEEARPLAGGQEAGAAGPGAAEGVQAAVAGQEADGVQHTVAETGESAPEAAGAEPAEDTTAVDGGLAAAVGAPAADVGAEAVANAGRSAEGAETGQAAAGAEGAPVPTTAETAAPDHDQAVAPQAATPAQAEAVAAGQAAGPAADGVEPAEAAQPSGEAGPGRHPEQAAGEPRGDAESSAADTAPAAEGGTAAQGVDGTATVPSGHAAVATDGAPAAQESAATVPAAQAPNAAPGAPDTPEDATPAPPAPQSPDAVVDAQPPAAADAVRASGTAVAPEAGAVTAPAVGTPAGVSEASEVQAAEVVVAPDVVPGPAAEGSGGPAPHPHPQGPQLAEPLAYDAQAAPGAPQPHPAAELNPQVQPDAAAPEAVPQAEPEASAPEALPQPQPDTATPETVPQAPPAETATTPNADGTPAQPTDATPVPAAAEAAPVAAGPAESAETGGQHAPAEPAEPLPSHVPPHPEQPLGQFVPVAGQVPTTPHLAPTPPQPLVLPTEETQQAAATVPAPREGEPAPAPDVVQHAEDLRTRAADQEEEGTGAVAEARQSTGPAAPGYADAEREAVLKVMRERRDIRNGFRSDPIPHEVLLRVLEAAHTAPSVGHSQPWDFVVIRSAETRRTMHELAMRQREAYAKSLPKGRAKQFKELKIEAILDTPVNIVVTADPTRGGRHTLGRHTQPQMAPYSSALAVENLWLAARAEGLGVGWVSFFDEREMVRALGLPEHLEVVAYLCVGYVDEFPDEPELMQAGWSKRRPLSWVVHEETYGRRALPGEEPHDLLAETVAQIRPLDAKALGEAWERQKRMTKPAGALGMLEIISAQLSGLSRQCPPPIPEPAAVAIFAGDHGVHAQGVTPWPQEVTAQMVANFLGGGAVCNAFAGQVGAEVCVVDVGVAADLPATPGLLPRKIRGGTSDMTTGPAMTREEAKQAIEVGIETARDLVAAGNKALLTGEMGIANTTASAALISVFTGADPAEVTGRGTGINDETLARKTEVVRRALELHQPDPADPIGVLAAIGGFEHAAMVGLLLGGASLRTPVILDGVSAGAAALVARAIAPEVLAACIAGHRSAEPGHVAALNKLGLRPLVDLDLRLGEGTGALLALPLVQSTARAMHEVATFDSAGVTEK